MGDPDLMMIDEPTEVLAPQIVERLADLLQKISARGIAILLVERKLTIALRIAEIRKPLLDCNLLLLWPRFVEARDAAARVQIQTCLKWQLLDLLKIESGDRQSGGFA